MFAVYLNNGPDNGFLEASQKRLKAYGVKNVVRPEKEEEQTLLQLAQAHGIPPTDHVLLIGAGDKLSNREIRRLTLSSVRLPQSLHVAKDGKGADDDFVAARVPWDHVQKSDLFRLSGADGGGKELLEAVLKRSNCASYNLREFTSGDTTRLGGSFAKSGVMKYFRKCARGSAASKLDDEKNFYRFLPENLQEHYPELLFFKDVKGETSFGIQYFDHPNVRDLLLNCEIRAVDAARILRKVLRFEYNEAYLGHLQPTPPGYLEDYHFDRVWHRLHASAEMDRDFADLVSSKWVVVNGTRLPNIAAMLYALEQTCDKALFTPEGVSKHVHGDLHLENVLVDPKTDEFHFVDPRGYPVCDIYYDLGKLSHCYNGKYDLLHEGRHQVTLGFDKPSSSAFVDFSFNCPTPEKKYDELSRLMQGITHEVLGAETEEQKVATDLKVKFNEAMHFCSVMPFHIQPDAKPNVAVPMYATGALLLAQTLRLMNKEPLECAELTDSAMEYLQAKVSKKWKLATFE